MIMQADIVKNIEQFEKGMKLQLKSDFGGTIYQGIVSDVQYDIQLRFVDGRPVKAKKVEKVTVLISAIRGETIEITRKNFANFRIKKVIQ